MKSFLHHFFKILQWLLIALLISGNSDSIGYCPSQVDSIINHSINTNGVESAKSAVDKNGSITLEAPLSSSDPAKRSCPCNPAYLKSK